MRNMHSPNSLSLSRCFTLSSPSFSLSIHPVSRVSKKRTRVVSTFIFICLWNLHFRANQIISLCFM
jgi:hypothetical protein